MQKLSIKIRIQIIIFVTIVLVSVVLVIQSISSINDIAEQNIKTYKEEAYLNKQIELKGYVSIATKSIESYYKRTSQKQIEGEVQEELKKQTNFLFSIIEKEYKDNKNYMDDDAIKEKIISLVNAVRYGKDGYFFINDMQSTMITHPIKPSLNGKDLSKVKDSTGKFLFNDFVKVCKADKEGIVKYLWPKPGSEKPQLKVTYVKLFEPFNWVVGTGTYVSDVKEKMQKAALKTVASMRFGKNGYFWIQDTNSKMIMHAIKSSLNGKDLSKAKDPNGILIFNEMSKVAKGKGEGVVNYSWPKPGYKKPQPKMSFVQLFKPWGWVIGTGEYIDSIEEKINLMREESAKQIRLTTMRTAEFSLTIAILLTLIVSFIANSSISKPIKKLEEIMLKISTHKDLSLTVNTDAPAEISQIGESFNTLMSSLKELISESKSSSSKNSSVSQQLSTTSLQVGKNVEKSVEIINEATNKATKITEDISIAIKDAKQSKDDVIEANNMLKEARDEIVYLTVEVQNSANSETRLANTVDALSTDAQQIKGVLEVISDIADQTNLLALNAAIEAARAGEHGRGFAVVADEVRKLAERTQKSLTEINATVSVIIQAISDASDQMNLNSNDMEKLATLANKVEEKINSTTKIVGNATKASDKTVEDFENTGSNIDSIAMSVNQINTISTENAKSVEEIASAADHLNNMTESLTNTLAQFKTN